MEPDDGKQPPPVTPLDPNPPQQGDATGDPFVIVKETRIGTTLPTFPAFATGLAIGMCFGFEWVDLRGGWLY